MSNRGLHKPVSGTALAFQGVVRNAVRMAYVTQLPDRDGWYMRYRDPTTGKYRWKKGGGTKQEAETLLALKMGKISAYELGCVDRHTYRLAEHALSPIDAHVSLYIASIRGRRKTEKHAKETRRLVQAWTEATGVETLDDADGVRTSAWLSGLLDRGVSHRTHNAYLKGARGFLAWCVVNGRLASNPLASIEVLNERADRRNPSRAMTPEQFHQLIDATPLPRRLFYVLAGRMGLRWGEVRRLTWQQFNLDESWLELAPKDTKNRRGELLPIPSDVIAELRNSPMRIGPIFDGAPTLRTWKNDLIRAGLVTFRNAKVKGKKKWNQSNLVGYENERGQLDRKSLRLTFGTHLAKAGVDLRMAQRLMRHSDPRLTATVYVDPVMLDMRAAAESVVGTGRVVAKTA